MKLTFRIVCFLIFIHLISCDKKGTPPVIESETPVIEDIDLNYSIWANSIFIAARVSDPQVLYEGDSVSVSFRLYRPGSSNPDTSGTLYDDRTHGDIIFHDGVFSTLLDSSFVGNDEGLFLVEVLAVDSGGNATDWQADSLTKERNSPPEVVLLYISSEVTQGDTILIQCKVTDAQGYDDILAVPYFALRPDSSILTNNSFLMRDDGAFGDIIAHDGIFTVKQPTIKPSIQGPGTPTGLWTIMIYALDYSNASSDTIPANVNILPEGI